MKKTIFLFALILGVSGLAVAQTCGTGNGYNNYGYSSNAGYGNDYYYNSNSQFLGTITSRWRGNFDRHRVVDARLAKNGRNKVTIEYFFANGDVLEVQARRRTGNAYGHHRGNGAQRGNGQRFGNNYHFNSNGNLPRGEFEIHCASINGRAIPINCGTLTVDRTNGRKLNTHLDMEVSRRESFKGTVRVFDF